MEKLGIEVRLNDEVKDIAAFGGNPVVIATGATPRLLRHVPGYEKMVEACEYLRSLKSNYPGKEQDIFDDIEQRLKSWKSSKK